MNRLNDLNILMRMQLELRPLTASAPVTKFSMKKWGEVAENK
jgi:hypothetical protein